MNTIKLDFSKCAWPSDMHEIMKDAFLFPSYYGMNWDALWDCGREYIEGPARIEVLGLDSLPKDWQEQIEIMKRVFKRLEEDDPELQFVYIS